MVNAEQVAVGTAKAAGTVGIAILLCGVADCICGFIWIGYGASDGHGLWSGLGFTTVGCLGIKVMWNLNKRVLVGYMGTCIVMTIVSSIQASIAGGTYANWTTLLESADCRTQKPLETCDDMQTITYTWLCIAIFSAIGAILTLAGSIIGFSGLCCGGPAPQRGAVVVQPPVVSATNTTYPVGHHPVPVKYPPGQYLPQFPEGQDPPQYTAEHEPPPPKGQAHVKYPPGHYPPQYPAGEYPPRHNTEHEPYPPKGQAHVKYPPGQYPPQYPAGEYPPPHTAGQNPPRHTAEHEPPPPTGQAHVKYPPGQYLPQYPEGQYPPQHTTEHESTPPTGQADYLFITRV